MASQGLAVTLYSLFTTLFRIHGQGLLGQESSTSTTKVEVIARAELAVAAFHIRVRHVDIKSDYIQARVPQDPLQTEDVTAVTHIPDRKGVAEGVRAASYALYTRASSAVLYDGLQPVHR